MSLTDCKAKSPQEALERFEEAVRTHEGLQNDRNQFDPQVVEAEYQEAKAEMLTWMPYIP